MLPISRGALLMIVMTGLILRVHLTASKRTEREVSISNKKGIQKLQRHRKLEDLLGTVPPWFDETSVPASPVSSFIDFPTFAPTQSLTEGETEFFTDSPTESDTDSDGNGFTESNTEMNSSTPTESSSVTDFPGTSDTILPTVSPETESQTQFPVTDPPTPSPVFPTDPPTPSSVTDPPTPTPTTDPPTFALTPNITNSPTASPTVLPSSAPTEEPESYEESTIKTTGGQETNCSWVPTSTGVSITETLELEYILYLNDGATAATASDTIAIQATVDLLQSKLHQSLADVSFNCSDLTDQAFSIVGLSHNGPGSDVVGASCSLEAGPSEATSCHKILAQMTVTVWFSEDQSRRSMIRQYRGLQSSPFGGNAAFHQFLAWLESAFAVLPDPNAGILATEFIGFVNLGGFDGTVLSDPHQSVDTPNSLIDSNKSIEESGLSLSYGHALIVVAGVIMVTLLVFVLGRRWRNGRAMKKHLTNEDNLHLDTIEELRRNHEIVDDESLFQEGTPLPEEFEVQLESLHHDYRTCVSPSCLACLRRKDPQFVLTDLRVMESNLESHRPRWLSPRRNDFEDTQML
jgi:hypothetical protein